jgi:HAD superfamily hydrolase (TIGR01509 family)
MSGDATRHDTTRPHTTDGDARHDAMRHDPHAGDTIVTPALVVFDCDGVLVDSERLMQVEFSAMLHEIGLPMSPEETGRTFLGRSMPNCLQIVEDRLGRAAPADFLDRLQERAFAAFARDLAPVPGASALLDTLDAAGIPYCVASSGSHEKMRTTLGRTGLLARLDGRLTSSLETARGKPFPDVFLLAASRMGVAPARCVVIEDSPLGIEAARAAGMRPIGLAGLMPAERLRAAGAWQVVTQLDAVPPLLALAPAPVHADADATH